jgi:hypothetical protein
MDSHRQFEYQCGGLQIFTTVFVIDDGLQKASICPSFEFLFSLATAQDDGAVLCEQQQTPLLRSGAWEMLISLVSWVAALVSSVGLLLALVWKFDHCHLVFLVL